MTIDQAKAVKMSQGKHAGVELGSIPIHYLKWLAKNWIRKDIRDAAIMVVNARGKDLGEELDFKPTYEIKSIPREVKKIDYSNVFFGELRTFLEEQPEGLF